MCVCARARACIRAYVRVCVCVRACAYVHVCMCVRVCARACVRACVCACAPHCWTGPTIHKTENPSRFSHLYFDYRRTQLSANVHPRHTSPGVYAMHVFLSHRDACHIAVTADKDTAPCRGSAMALVVMYNWLAFFLEAEAGFLRTNNYEMPHCSAKSSIRNVGDLCERSSTV